MQDEPSLSEAKLRILDLLKRTSPTSAGQLADRLDLTAVAVRQHLQDLEEEGLVESQTSAPEGRGRPSLSWTPTPRARSQFPDRHGELTVGLLGAMREAFGEEGIGRILGTRTRQQVEAYRARMPGAGASLKERLAALAQMRSEEGYMAEVRAGAREGWLLIEHHCPICDAARSCLGLCASELEVFQQVLGGGVQIERTAHVLSGDERCVYEVRERQTSN